MAKVRFGRLLAIGFAAVSLMVAPAMAQEAPLGPGEGQPIILGNFGGDITTTNPLLVNDGSSQDVVSRLFPVFIGSDPDTGVETPGVPNSLATEWSFSEDGRTLTIKLRTDRVWSDGTPITSADIQYAYDAIASGEIDSPLGSYLATVESLTTPDAETVEITFTEPDCAAVTVAANIPAVPAHYYSEIYPTFADMTTDNPANLNPEVTSNAFKFANFRAGEQVTLVADQTYPDSPAGYVVPEGWVYKSVADQILIVEQFLAGQITIVQSVPEDREAEMAERAAAGEFILDKRPAGGWQVLLFNTANPANPQAGLDEEGNIVEQDPHPVLSDLAVRQAITHAIDHAALNEGAFAGTGIPVGGPMLRQSWAYNENLQPYAFDPELAASLLEEAGWVDSDGDGIREKDGVKLTLALTTFSGNPSVDASTVLIQDQLGRVGFEITLDVIEFSSMLDKLVGQTYDMLMVFWGVTNNAPQDMFDMLSSVADAPGTGFGVTSFYNEEFETLMKEARTLPGCDVTERKALYDRAQEIVYNNVPWYLVNTSVVPIAVTNGLENWEPRENSIYWNLPAWSIR
jgi:peptide/nickel transport system substrate-binding protein